MKGRSRERKKREVEDWKPLSPAVIFHQIDSGTLVRGLKQAHRLLRELLLFPKRYEGKRQAKITARRTQIDWAHFIKEMLEERYVVVEKVVLYTALGEW